MAVLTLRRMAEGGIFDQLGGGFCRYSVDPFWMIPHFEKMLYDNGPLLALCAQAAAATDDAVLRNAALATAGWALREMRAPGGGFYAALDADSEGHEGRFYVWQRDEVETPPRASRISRARAPLRARPRAEFRGRLASARLRRDGARGGGLALQPSEADALLASARAKLFDARAQRVRPGLDDKVLTAWNALMIRGLAIAGRQLDQPRLIDAALAALDFLRANAWRDGMLYAAWKAGEARFPAYLDDYAYLLDALLESLQSRFRAADLQFCLEIADALLDRFADRERGGFWFTAAGQDPPLYRPKGFADDVDALGQRRRGAGARASRLAHGRDALPRRRGGGRARRMACACARPGGALRRAQRARRVPRPGRDRDHPRRRRRSRGMAT